MSKKSLLFVMNHLGCGGAEKALISLLSTLDYEQYDVDLLLFKQEGLFLSHVPKQVRLLPAPRNYPYFDMSIKLALKESIKRGQWKLAIARIRAGYIFRMERNRVRCEQLVWRHLSKGLEPLTKVYDAAIGYLEKTPIYYCVEKVQAAKKIGFIHNDYDQLGMDAQLDQAYFARLDVIATVSEHCAAVLKERFPQHASKVNVMYNIVSPKTIQHLAAEGSIRIESIGSEKQAPVNIVTVGRLSAQKGMDLAIQAAAMLVERGYVIQWTVIGEGEERSQLEKLLIEHKLAHCFHLIGIKANPYPDISAADIYVQPSRFEGKSIAIDEAKILGRPIVATQFSTVYDQLTHEVNALIVEMKPAAIAAGIERLIQHPALRQQFSAALAQEQLGTEDEIEKIYAFV